MVLFKNIDAQGDMKPVWGIIVPEGMARAKRVAKVNIKMGMLN